MDSRYAKIDQNPGRLPFRSHRMRNRSNNEKMHILPRRTLSSLVFLTPGLGLTSCDGLYFVFQPRGYRFPFHLSHPRLRRPRLNVNAHVPRQIHACCMMNKMSQSN